MIMQAKKSQLWYLLFLGLILLIGCVQGAVTTINQGNTVFIGEQGLDISGAMGSDTKIGWWASGADLRGSSPDKTLDVATQLNSFSVSPSVFSGFSGSWYRLDNTGKADGSAFIVADPQINIRVEDVTVGADVQNMNNWVPTGDSLRFKIETNLAQISSQRGSPALVTIKVQPPGGGVFNALINDAGTPVSIVDIPITTTPYTTDSIWNTGNRANYPPGSYQVWAECNTNKMKDNYEQTGKTVTQRISFVNQDQNSLIGAKTLTTSPTTAATVKITTRATTIPVTTPSAIITTLQTVIPTTPPTTMPTTNPPTSIPASPMPTKTPGFEAFLACISLVIGGIVCYWRK
jgi:hypothetical protein